MEHAQDKTEILSREVAHLRKKLGELEALRAELDEVMEALRDSETRFQAVTAFAGYAFVFIGSSNEIVFWNVGAENMFDYAKEDVLGRPVSMVIPNLDIHRQSGLISAERGHRSRLQRMEERTLELTGLRKNGDEFPLEVSLSSPKSKGQDFFAALIRDISFRKSSLRKLEIKTAEARQKTEDMESFIQTVAHDLKSPVIAVAGLTRRLGRSAERLPPDAVREELLSRIEAGAQSIEAFLKDLLDGLALFQSRRDWMPVQPETMIDEVVRRHEHEIAEQGIRLEIDMEDALPAIAGNRHRLTQVLDNLLVNAIVHMGPGPNPTIRIACRCDKESVVTSVSDNGTGIAPQYQTKIFERFFRSPDASSARGGTGLGLFIAKRIVESHEGRIWVESEEGKGATFFFELPKAEMGETGHYEI